MAIDMLSAACIEQEGKKKRRKCVAEFPDVLESPTLSHDVASGRRAEKRKKERTGVVPIARCFLEVLRATAHGPWA